MVASHTKVFKNADGSVRTVTSMEELVEDKVGGNNVARVKKKGFRVISFVGPKPLFAVANKRSPN